MCNDCFDKHTDICSCCGLAFKNEMFHIVDGIKLCSDCFENNIYYCIKCKEPHLEKNVYAGYFTNKDETSLFCINCIDKDKIELVSCKDAPYLFVNKKLAIYFDATNSYYLHMKNIPLKLKQYQNNIYKEEDNVWES